MAFRGKVLASLGPGDPIPLIGDSKLGDPILGNPK